MSLTDIDRRDREIIHGGGFSMFAATFDTPEAAICAAVAVNARCLAERYGRQLDDVRLEHSSHASGRGGNFKWTIRSQLVEPPFDAGWHPYELSSVGYARAPVIQKDTAP